MTKSQRLSDRERKVRVTTAIDKDLGQLLVESAKRKDVAISALIERALDFYFRSESVGNVGR